MAVTPGQSIVGTVDVGGSQAGSQRSNFAYGYRHFSARNNYDGTNCTEGQTSMMVYVDYGAVAELRQTTAGNDASMPVPGTYMNAIVKQGSDTTHAGIYFDYENPSFQGHNISDAQLKEGSGTGSRLTRYEDLDGEIGGHVMKGKWWYYISIRTESFGSSVTGFPAESPSMANPPFYHTNLAEHYGKEHLEAEEEPPHHRVHRLEQQADALPQRGYQLLGRRDLCSGYGLLGFQHPLRGHHHAQVLSRHRHGRRIRLPVDE